MDAWESLRSCRVAILATIDPSGRPHLVPITFILEGGSLYSVVDHKPKATTDLKRLSNIEIDPRVSVLAHNYSEDWESLWWVRIDGTAEVLRRPPEPTIGAALAEKYHQYRDKAPAGPVIRVTPEIVRSWDAK